MRKVLVRKVLWLIASVISLFMVLAITFAPIKVQAYFGLPFGGFLYGGYGFPYNVPGYPYLGSGLWIPYYGGIQAYGGILGFPYATALPPDLSGWTWTSPTEAYSPSFPDGTNGAISVDWAAGYEWQSPYYQQNYPLGSPYGQVSDLYTPGSLGAPPDSYDPYGPSFVLGLGWIYPYQAIPDPFSIFGVSIFIPDYGWWPPSGLQLAL